MRIYAKKMQKNLVISKKSSTFAPAFGERLNTDSSILKAKGAIAQLVEQRTENPCVPSSILGGTTKRDSKLGLFLLNKNTRYYEKNHCFLHPASRPLCLF